MTTVFNAQPDLARRILRAPPARVLVLGLILLLMMGLNTDVMTSYAAEPAKAAQHIVALAIAGFACISALGTSRRWVPAGER